MPKCILLNSVWGIRATERGQRSPGHPTRFTLASRHATAQDEIARSELFWASLPVRGLSAVLCRACLETRLSSLPEETMPQTSSVLVRADGRP